MNEEFYEMAEEKQAMAWDDVIADRAVRRRSELVKERDRMRGILEAEIAQLQQELIKSDEGYDRQIAELDMRLKWFFDGVEHKTTKTGVEKYKLPAGTLKLTPPSWKYKVDDKQLTEWLEAHGETDYIKVEKRPAWGELKKIVFTMDDGSIITEHGEVIDGVTAEKGDATFKVG